MQRTAIENSSPRRCLRRILWYAVYACLWWGCTSATVVAQLPPTVPNPRLNWLFPAGGQASQTVEVTVTGDDLDEARALHFDCPGITAKLKHVEPGLGHTSPQPAYGTFLVTIGADVPVGCYDLRVWGKFGLSTPRAFVVGRHPEVQETKPNNLPRQAQIVPVGTTINGTCESAALDYYRFSAKQGQRILIDCQAFRIDSRLDGTLVLYDANGKELERSHNVNRRDPFIDFTVPVDGDYLVSLHDHMYDYYAFAGECYYRLTISTDPVIDFVFPPIVKPGHAQKLALYGRNLPGGESAPGIEVAGKELQRLEVQVAGAAVKPDQLNHDRGFLVEPSESFLDGFLYRLKTEQGDSNPVVVTFSDAPVVIEQEPNNDPAHAQRVQFPCEIAGQFYPRGDRDWACFEAKQGEVLYLDVYSQRLGLQTDPRLVLQQVRRNAKGEEVVIDLQTVDDDLGNSERVHWSMLDSVLFSTNTLDPSYRFVVPEDGLYRVLVQDLSRPSQDLARTAKGNARHAYRLAIRQPQPDFRLVAVPRPPTNLPVEQTVTQTVWSSVLQPGGATLIEVFAQRRDGFNGPIVVTADHLPPGVTAEPAIITPGQISTTLILQAAETAPSGISSISIHGTSRIGSTEITHESRYGSMIWAIQLTGVTYHRSRLTSRLPVSVIPGDLAAYRLHAEPGLKLVTSLAGTVKFPVSVQRRGGFQGALELFTYGLPPSIYGPLHAQPKFHLPTVLPANQATTEFVLTVPNHVPPGTYTFFLSGVGTISQVRNTEKLKEQSERLAVIEKIVAENQVRLKSATEAQAAAAKALAEAQTAMLDVKSLLEAKTAADRQLTEIDQKTKRDAAFLQTFLQEVNALKEKSKPTDLKISAPSNQIKLTITPAPFELQFAAQEITVRANQKVDLPFQVQRLFGFDAPVVVTVQPISNNPGVTAAGQSLAVGQSNGTLVIQAGTNAVPGTFTTLVTASGTYNGQPLSVKTELKLKIEGATTNR